MKQLILFVLAGCGFVLTVKQCCSNDKVIRRSATFTCGENNEEILDMGKCRYGKYLLRDVLIIGNEVSTRDSPQYFAYVNYPNRYCLGKMYRDINNKSLGTIPVAVICRTVVVPPPTVQSNGFRINLIRSRPDYDDDDDDDDDEDEESAEGLHGATQYQ